MSVFNFLKKEYDKIDNIDDIIGIDEEVTEDAQDDICDISLKELYESLEYNNSFLAQVAINLGELVKQQTIANALNILDTEYNNADSVMKVNEILKKKEALLGEVFIDYQQKPQNDK